MRRTSRQGADRCHLLGFKQLRLSLGQLASPRIDPSLQLEVLEQFEALDFVGLDTMNFWIEGKPRELGEVLKRVDVLL